MSSLPYRVERRRIHLRGLELMARIGLYADEKVAPQRLTLDLELEVEPDSNSIRSVDQVVDYGSYAETIHALVVRDHVDLLETLAEHIIDICFEDSRVVAIDLRLEKPDVLKNAAGAGISVSVRR